MPCRATSQTSSSPWGLTSAVNSPSRRKSASATPSKPSTLFGFEESFLLYIVHLEGFFKTLVRPGQVVFFRTHQLRQVYPLAPPLGPDRPRSAVSLAMRKYIAALDTCNRRDRRRIKYPPQPGPDDKGSRISYVGTWRGRQKKGRGPDGDEGSGPDGDEVISRWQEKPELDGCCGGRQAWEQYSDTEGEGEAEEDQDGDGSM